MPPLALEGNRSSYATRADLERRFSAEEIVRLADPDDAGADRTVTALADASAEIDGALAITWELPLPTGKWPLLISIACDLARERLYDDAELEAPRRRAAKARELLGQLRDGVIWLVDGSGTRAARRSAASESGPEPAMTGEGLELF